MDPSWTYQASCCTRWCGRGNELETWTMWTSVTTPWALWRSCILWSPRTLWTMTWRSSTPSSSPILREPPGLRFWFCYDGCGVLKLLRWTGGLILLLNYVSPVDHYLLAGYWFLLVFVVFCWFLRGMCHQAGLLRLLDLLPRGLETQLCLIRVKAGWGKFHWCQSLAFVPFGFWHWETETVVRTWVWLQSVMSAQEYRREREREKKKSTTQSVLQVNTEVRLADMPANKFGRQKHGANTSKHVLLVSCLWVVKLACKSLFAV